MTDPREHLRQTVRTHRRRIVGATLLSVAQALLLLPVPLLLGYAFDTALPDERRGLIVGLAAATAVVVVASGAAGVASMRLQIGTAARIGFELRTALYRRLFAAPREMFDQQLVGPVHDRVVNDSLRTVEMYGAALNKLVPDIIITVGVGIILFVLDWKLALVTLGFVPVLLLVSRFMIARQHPATRRYHGVFREFSTRVMLVLRSQDLIRITGSEAREIAAADVELEELTAAHTRFEFIAAAHRATQQSIIGVTGAALLVAGGYAVVGGSMSLGELLAFYAAFAMLRGPAGRSAGAYAELIGGWHAYERVVEFLDDPLERPYRGTQRVELDQALECDAVSFGYDPERPIVDRLSFRVEVGRVTALVGPNGSGKSTVVNLLLGFYRPDDGGFAVDGTAYDDIDINHLRSQLGVVPQEPFMLPGTIRENIVYGNDPSDEDLDRALQLSGASQVVAHLPGGLETVVGEDGQLLSGGQRQRLAIARALIGNPTVLVLDEPTNHLDERAIGDLLDRLRDLRGDLAVLLISHQRAVTDMADDVVELGQDRPA